MMHSKFSRGGSNGTRPSGNTLPVQLEHINLYFDSGSFPFDMERHQRGERTKGMFHSYTYRITADLIKVGLHLIARLIHAWVYNRGAQ